MFVCLYLGTERGAREICNDDVVVVAAAYLDSSLEICDGLNSHLNWAELTHTHNYDDDAICQIKM